MRPLFRTDLTCSREEQQGVVFYRIDDPQSQTSFRLYEIEYLIAQKLDGKRTFAEVIEAVKEDYNFDISEPDLQKFVGQLESMGFISKPEEMVEAAAAEFIEEVEEPDTTLVMARPKAAEPEMQLELEGEPAPVDDIELRRLLKSALLHVKQGYIVHARDYFLAAKELDPSDARLATLVSHLEIIGDSSGPAEVEYLWGQAKELFPDVAEEVGPLEAGTGGSEKVSNAAGRATQAWDDDLRARILWMMLFLVLVVGGAGGLYFFAREAHIFEGAPHAKIRTVQSTRLPVFYKEAAKSVAPVRETWLHFGSAGKIAEVSVKPGERVAADEQLAAFELPKPIAKQIAAAKAAVKKATADYDKARDRLQKVIEDRQGLEAEANQAQEKLRELSAKSVLGKGSVSRRDIEKWKRIKAKVNKKLSQLAKKERQPRAQEKKAKDKLAATEKRLDGLEAKIAPKLLRAPFAGVITEIKVAAGDNVGPNRKAMLLRDTSAVRLRFVLAQAGDLQVGGEAFVSLSRGAPTRAKIAAVESVKAGSRVDVLLPDPTGSLVDTAAGEFQLVREYVDPAFAIPASAVFSSERGDHVLVELQGRALVRDVTVVSKSATTAIIRDRSGALRDGEHIVVERVGNGDVSTIADGSFLEIEK